MLIQEQDLKDLINQLNNKWRNKNCPMCGQSSLIVDHKVYEVREFNNGSLISTAKDISIIPIVPITCKECGYTMFINAILTKTVSRPNNNEQNDVK